MKYIPKNKHAVIKVCKKILNIDDDITVDHVDQLRVIMINHLNCGMSPADIKNHYLIEYSDFGMFLKKSLGIKLKNIKDAVNNFNKKIGRSITDEKYLYRKKCNFAFDPYSIPDIPGYDKLLKLGIYHPIENPNGVCRDHMISVEYGWRNNISPNIISHPCNCQFITNLENIFKNSRCSITIDELMDRIKNDNLTPINRLLIDKKTLSNIHKQRISKTNKKYMTVTNEIINLRILKTNSIPSGFRKGMKTKRCKKSWCGRSDSNRHS